MPRTEAGSTAMPLTKAGQRLWAEVEWWDYFGDDAKGMSLVDYIDAIEAEAVAAERERIRGALDADQRNTDIDLRDLLRHTFFAIVNPEADR